MNERPEERIGGRPRRLVPGRQRGRRRPSGEPPALPHAIGRSGRFWLRGALYFALFVAVVLAFGPFLRAAEAWDAAQLRFVARLRGPRLTDTALLVNGLASRWVIRGLRWATIGTLLVFRRWRHLLVYLLALIAVEVVAYQLSLVIGRRRSLGVEILAGWTGFSMPSRPLASLAITLIGIAYTVVVPGRWRSASKWTIAAVIGLVGLARVYLAVDQPSSVWFGAVLGVAGGVTI